MFAGAVPPDGVVAEKREEHCAPVPLDGRTETGIAASGDDIELAGRRRALILRGDGEGSAGVCDDGVGNQGYGPRTIARSAGGVKLDGTAGDRLLASMHVALQLCADDRRWCRRSDTTTCNEKTEGKKKEAG